jgi:hypothetical protein
MSAHHAGPQHGDLHNADVHHEESDINVRAIIWFVVVLGGVVLSMNVSMWGMFKVLQHFERKNEPYVTPLARPAGETPPEPRLQTVPWTDLHTFRAEQERSLHGYGWVDEKLGVAHVPIAKAKEMLLQKGIPVRPELAEESAGTHLAATGESNGGRTIPAGGADKSSTPAAGATGAGAAPGAAGAGAPGAPATATPGAAGAHAPAAAPKKPGGGR